MATLTLSALAFSQWMAPLFAASLLDRAIYILYVALGLGLVIFFHELGHFAVAKWCNVHVERFSIGFGPILWSFKRGETEYALSLIPFGGYVKMLGQDDMDATQMTNEEIAQDPRSYSAKSVPQRMAIISAGVIMNIITGMLFFAIAFSIGVEMSPSVIGGTQPGSPAWEAGLDYGDRITQINDRKVESFQDIMRGVALTSGTLTIQGEYRDGGTFKEDIIPDGSGTRRIIGAAPMTDSLTVIDPQDTDISIYDPNSPASQLPEGEGFQPRDTIKKVAIHGQEPQEVSDYPQLKRWLAGTEVRKSPVDFYVERDGKLLSEPITVGPTPFRRLGLRMDISKITAVADQSPARVAGFKEGDKIIEVDGKPIDTEVDPLSLPDYFYSRTEGSNAKSEKAGQDGEDAVEADREVLVKVARPQEEGPDKVVELRVTPGDRPGWTFIPYGQDVPLDVPSIGLAYHITPIVRAVIKGSPADKAGIKAGERLKKIEFLPPEDDKGDALGTKSLTIYFEGEEAEGKQNWAFAFRVMQLAPDRPLKLTVIDDQGEARNIEMETAAVDDWFLPDNRGIRLQGSAELHKAPNFLAAVGMGIEHTKNSASDIYLTLRNLFGGNISAKELHGPVGIAKVAYDVAESGLPQLLLFLGFLSVNLAVLNFLPIPVLDGGHMVFLIWEGVTRSKPSERVLWAAQALGFLFVVALMLFVLFLDIFVHGHVN